MITKSIILNAWENNKQKVLAVQGEVGARWLDITLLDEKIPLDLTNCFAVIYMDTGVVIYNSCEITDALNGQISVELTQNMSGIYGDFEAEIHIYDELGNLLKIKGLEITIRKSTDVTVTVEARDEFTALQQALSTVGEYSGRIDTNVTDILTNAENIAENREDIDENRTDIDTNTRNIQTLNANKADKTETDRLEDEKANIDDIANGTITVNTNTIQGISISATAPTENQVLKMISGVWTPSKLISSISSGTISTTSSRMTSSITLPFVPLRIRVYDNGVRDVPWEQRSFEVDRWNGTDFSEPIFTTDIKGSNGDGQTTIGHDKIYISLKSNVLTITKYLDTIPYYSKIIRPYIGNITFNYVVLA